MPTPLHVLILEDNPSDEQLMLHALRRVDYDPVGDTVETEQDFRNRLNPAIEVILSDFSMPSFDALRALEILRESRLDIPFIIVSGSIGEDRAVQLMKHGATDYIVKDRMGRLGLSVKQALERKAIATALRHERQFNEEALRRSDERVRELTEHVDQALWLMDAKEHRILYISPAYEKLWGRSCQSLFDDPESYLEVTHPLDVDLMRRANARMFVTGHIDVECRLLRSDGSVKWVWVRGNPIVEDNQLVRIAGVIEDITEKKNFAAEREALLARHQLYIERMPLAYILFDGDFRIIEWNPAAERIFGYARTEMLGKGPPHEAIVLPTLWEEYERTRSRIQAGDMDAHTINENLTKDGRTIICQCLNTPLTSADGQFVGMLSLVNDITARRESEVALKLRDRAIQAVTQGILITDPNQPDNPIIFVSPGFEQITGFSANEVVGRNCRILQSEDTDPAVVSQLRNAIEAGESCAVEMLNYRKDGSPFWNELSISPVRDESDRLTHFVGVLADITARRNLEEQFRQSQKMDAIGQLAGGIAHDFNNLLTIINGYSDLLLQDLPQGDPSRELIEEIHSAGERSAGLTRQLLAFSRRQVLAPKILDLNEVVVDTEKLLRRLLGEDVHLATSMHDALWAIRADSGQIEQVLINLAVNARDAMPKGGQLTIETRNVVLSKEYTETLSDAHPGPHVLLSLSDTGTGIPPEVKAKIFEPFFTTKGPGKGTGLGLATVYGIIKQSGGHLAVYSEVGIGTTFKMYLPQAEGVPGAVKVSPAASTQSPPRGSETILLAEDEDGVRALTRSIMVGCGYTVLEAGDGDEAILVANEHAGPIHMLITDVVMPGTGGRAVAERVAARHPDVRVLFVSGYTDDAVIRHGVLREGVNFLQKPFSPLALAFKVREVLDAQLETACL